MRLKVITTVFLILGFGLLFAWPRVLLNRPAHGASLGIRKQFGYKLLGYTAAVVVVFAGAARGAILIVRETRAEFKRQSLENMQQLIAEARKEAGVKDQSNPD